MGSGTWVVGDTTSVTFASGACLTSSMTLGSRGGTATAVPSVGAKVTVAARKLRTRTPMVIIWLKLAIFVEFD